MPLNEKQIERIQEESRRYKSVVDQAGKASTELWKARIDMSIAAGETDIDKITKPGDAVAWGDTNSPCNNQCNSPLNPGDMGMPIRN